MKKLQKELDEAIEIICEQIKDKKSMTGQEIDTVNALARLVSARALVGYVSKVCADPSPVSDA